ncbi:hypothetical protein ACP70R_002431 [Stipagrostis hirtigluma subsp. patula]
MVSEDVPAAEVENTEAAAAVESEEAAPPKPAQEDEAPVLVEDVKDDDDDDEDDDDDDGADEGELGAGANEGSRQSRSEKKSRKAMMKLGMKPVTGVSRITIKRAKNTVRGVQARRVQEPTSETYVIFGEAKIEDLSSQLQAQAAQQFRMQDLSKVMAKQDAAAGGRGRDRAARHRPRHDAGQRVQGQSRQGSQGARRRHRQRHHGAHGLSFMCYAPRCALLRRRSKHPVESPPMHGF